MRNRPLDLLGQSISRLLPAVVAIMLTGTTAQATLVNFIGGALPSGTYHGYADGDTFLDARFYTPSGLALDGSGEFLLVADRDNNAIRILDLANDTTATFVTNKVSKPVSVAVDADDNVYVLSQGNGKNGTVITYDGLSDILITNATKLTNAAAMALDPANNIYVTVQSNKLIRIAAGTANQTVVTTINIPGTSLQGIVVKHNGLIAACDSGRNGIYLIDPSTGIFTTNAGFNGRGDFITNSTDVGFPTSQAYPVRFNQPMQIAETGDGKLLISDYGNNRFKVVTPSGVVSNLYGVTSQFWTSSTKGWSADTTVKIPDSVTPNVEARLPYGIVIGPDGTTYTSEDYYHLIRKTTSAGVLPPLPPAPAAPQSISAVAGYGVVTVTWTASPGATNYNVKHGSVSGGEITIASVPTNSLTYIDTSELDGTTNYYQVSAVNTSGEGPNSAEVVAVPLFSPVPTNVTVITTNYNLISLSWSPSTGASSYNVYRSGHTGPPYSLIGNTASSHYADTSVSNGVYYYYVVSAVNPGGESVKSLEVIGKAPLPPVPDPRIGYVDFVFFPSTGFFYSVFHPITSFVLNNDAYIVIEGTPGTVTYYTIGTTITNQLGIATNPPDPTASSPSAPVGYADGLGSLSVAAYSIAQPAPDQTIKAIGEKTDGSPNSAIVSARIQYVTANPNIIGANAAAFTISDITSGAHLYYTIDGSDPSATNSSAVDLGVSLNSSNTWAVSFAMQSDTLFKVRAFRANFQDSGIVSNLFLASAFQPTSISFGFGTGEGSSAFIASAGQTFYAPITLNLVANPTIYSMQFNLTVTNGVTNSGPPIVAGTFGFNSLLEKPIPGVSPVTYEPIPPAMFSGLAAVPNPIYLDGSTAFSGLMTTNTALNLLGIGWVERAGETNLYDTTKQTLIQYSRAHDDQFLAGGGKVIVGGFNIVIPANAQTNQTYQIQIGRPSATTDGVGAPGSDVFISAPTNGGTGAGTINALKYITVGQYKYIVGSVSPFRWFNAGDFGSSNIVSADVAQVFEAAVYFLNSPEFQAPGSDFLDAMDSSGNLGALDSDPADPNNGYYTNSLVSYIGTYGSYNPLFDGNDTTINQDVFGDGTLDVSDVYVTFRRGLDPSLTWFRRFWNNGQRVADTGAPNIASHAVYTSGGTTIKSKVQYDGPSPQVNFTAGDIIGSAGQTVQIPISATVIGNYPLRLLMLNLTVTALDGSPALTAPVSFTQTASVLGAPYKTDSKGAGNYSSVWLNVTNSGLTGTTVIGTLNVTIPASAGSSAAYAIHFDHASGSPNGLASFPNTKLTGLLTTSSKNSSSYSDGIPDSWRLRWFGTINNILSASNACPSGDGVPNWKKFVAGVDPNTANDFPAVKSKSIPSGYNAAIHWPTVNGKQYVIERSSILFSGAWTSISTNTGTGGDMEYDDSNSNSVKFYRVRILP